VEVPFERVIEFAMLGYGTGTGPPGLGVLQTSGMVAVVIPVLNL
jgi:hypothetical protein